MKGALLVIFIALFPLLAEPSRRGPLAGGWAPIKNLKDPHIQDIASFAVSQYNKQSNSNLKLSKVLNGESQVVAGINYRLTLRASSGGYTRNYIAVVWERVWLNSRILTSFDPVQK